MVEPGVEAAGFRNGFRCRAARGRGPLASATTYQLGPPLDARRSRAVVTDPLTGDIIKSTVTLGSLRDRQDYMNLLRGLSPYARHR